MKVLVIDEEIPFPMNSGKRLRTLNLLKPLAKRHEITFLCRYHEDTDKPDIQAMEQCGIRTRVVPHPIRKKAGLKFYSALLANLASKAPYSVTSHYSKQMMEATAQILAERPYDLIHCEWTPYAVNLKSFLSGPSVVVAHNVESLIWQRYFEVESNLLKKAYIYLQWKKMERFESMAFQMFTQTVAVSDQDRQAIEQWIPKERVSVVENGVDVSYFQPSSDKSKPFSLVFTGAMDWRPNVDAMFYFIDEIWARVLRDYPQSTLTIVGRNPMATLRDHVQNMESVKLTGTVDDVRPYLNAAQVYIVPLRVGGGSRLKILEAFSMGLPVVSTSVGAEGLCVTQGQHVLFANDPQNFADAIVELFNDQLLRKQLGEEGQRLVHEHYRWDSLARRLEEVWEKTVENKRSES
jgi:glycosyltransferase involved in cell wall biosynthesis